MEKNVLALPLKIAFLVLQILNFDSFKLIVEVTPIRDHSYRFCMYSRSTSLERIFWVTWLKLDKYFDWIIHVDIICIRTVIQIIKNSCLILETKPSLRDRSGPIQNFCRNRDQKKVILLIPSPFPLPHCKSDQAVG